MLSLPFHTHLGRQINSFYKCYMCIFVKENSMRWIVCVDKRFMEGRNWFHTEYIFLLKCQNCRCYNLPKQKNSKIWGVKYWYAVYYHVLQSAPLWSKYMINDSMRFSLRNKELLDMQYSDIYRYKTLTRNNPIHIWNWNHA